VNTLIEQGPVALFAAFVVMHALVDFPLQGDFIAKQKTRKHADNTSIWIVALTSHGVLHGGGVWLISGSLAFGFAEMILHLLIDIGKGENRFGIITDQLLHVGCKLVYAILLGYGIMAP
jgi:hypothetical protein